VILRDTNDETCNKRDRVEHACNEYFSLEIKTPWRIKVPIKIHVRDNEFSRNVKDMLDWALLKIMILDHKTY
jgi:hypothetical protein